jgi:hypothetical protein
VLATKLLGANGDVAQKPATPFSRQKSATNGCEAVQRCQKARATPCSAQQKPRGVGKKPLCCRRRR